MVFIFHCAAVARSAISTGTVAAGRVQEGDRPRSHAEGRDCRCSTELWENVRFCKRSEAQAPAEDKSSVFSTFAEIVDVDTIALQAGEGALQQPRGFDGMVFEWICRRGDGKIR